jgi:uncharacterized protein (DUF433 family)
LTAATPQSTQIRPGSSLFRAVYCNSYLSNPKFRSEPLGTYALRASAESGLRTWYNPVVNVIVKNKDILGGTPVFRGTRVPIQALFDYLEGGETIEDFLQGFPTVTREAALAALEEAKDLLLARS